MTIRLTWIGMTAVVTALASLGTRAADVACLVFVDGYWQAAVLDLRNGQPTVVTRSASDKTRVSWFPDGRLLVNRADGVLTVVDTATRTERELTLEHKPILDAIVRPDGRQIAYSFSTAPDGNDVWVRDLPSLRASQVLPMPALQHEPAWTLDGDALYFLSGDGGQAHDIWRVSLNDGSREQLTTNSLYHFDLAVGPKETLAYSSNRDGNYELYMSRPGGVPERLTDDPALDGAPAFSADGELLLFESSRSGTVQIYRLDLKSRRILRVTNVPGGARRPTWRASHQVEARQ